MTILSKGRQPDNFESHKSLKLSFTNIWGLCLNFAEWESFLELNCPDVVALCETNLDNLINSDNLSVMGYLPLFQKDSVTHMHSLVGYVRERVPFAWDLSLENSVDSYLYFWLAYYNQCLTSFSSIDHLVRLHAQFLMIFSSNIDEALSINPSTNVFVFRNFNIHHKDGLTYSSQTDRLVNSVIIFLPQMTLLRWLTLTMLVFVL